MRSAPRSGVGDARRRRSEPTSARARGRAEASPRACGRRRATRGGCGRRHAASRSRFRQVRRRRRGARASRGAGEHRGHGSEDAFVGHRGDGGRQAVADDGAPTSGTDAGPPPRQHAPRPSRAAARPDEHQQRDGEDPGVSVAAAPAGPRPTARPARRARDGDQSEGPLHDADSEPPDRHGRARNEVVSTAWSRASASPPSVRRRRPRRPLPSAPEVRPVASRTKVRSQIHRRAPWPRWASGSTSDRGRHARRRRRSRGSAGARRCGPDAAGGAGRRRSLSSSGRRASRCGRAPHGDSPRDRVEHDRHAADRVTEASRRRPVERAASRGSIRRPLRRSRTATADEVGAQPLTCGRVSCDGVGEALAQLVEALPRHVEVRQDRDAVDPSDSRSGRGR